MKQSKISRRSFLLGLGAVSAAAALTACGGSSSASTATAASGSAASGSSVVYRTLDQIKEVTSTSENSVHIMPGIYLPER